MRAPTRGAEDEVEYVMSLMHRVYNRLMRLADARRYALSLPEVTEQPHFVYASFRVRGRIFATVPPDGKHMHVFAAETAREIALELHGECVEKLWWGRKVVGVRIRLADAAPEVVKGLLMQAWVNRAPRKLAAQVA